MLFITYEYGLEREFILLLRYFASYMLFYFSYQTGKRVNKASILTATTGLTCFFVSSGLMHLINTFRFFYFDPSYDLFFSVIVSIIHISGIILFIFLVELDNARHGSNQAKKGFSYKFTVIALTFTIIAYPIIFAIIGNPSLIFLFIIIPTVILFMQFSKKFQSLQIIRGKRVVQWFVIGMMISGFSNFLNVPILRVILGNWASALNSSLIVIGCLMMAYSWNRLPLLSELDWLKKMERLMVLHFDSSGLIYQYDFQFESSSGLKEGIDAELAGTAIGGITSLLKEILDSRGNIREIDHGGKKILFKQGIRAVSILLASGYSDEMWYRLGMFHSAFEKKFDDPLRNWVGDITLFSKTEDLIFKYFLE